MINLNYENIKKAYKKYLFEQELKAFLKRQYGIEEKTILKPKVIKKLEIKKEKLNNTEIKTNFSIEEKVSELNEFLQTHFERVGKEQAIKDFQRGLNILNNYDKTSNLEVKRPIKEDGGFGKITNAVLNRICKFYPTYLIKRAVKIGAINNAYNKYCFDKKTNIKKDLEEIQNNLSYAGDSK